MNFTRFGHATLVALALALAGCGLTASPADGLNFKAPDGWQSSPGIMGFMQFWKAPGNDKEVLMLFKSPKPIDTKEAFQNAKLKDATIEQQKQMTICGNQPATYLEARGSSSSGDDSNIRMLVTNANGNTYFAMYVYSVGTRPNADATASLSELCPVKSS